MKSCTSDTSYVLALPMTIISFKLKDLEDLNGIPASFALASSAFLSDQYRIAQATAAAAAHIACSFESMSRSNKASRPKSVVAQSSVSQRSAVAEGRK